MVSSQRYGVVLYNFDAMESIHHVSDKAFFEPTLSSEEIKALVNSAIKEKSSRKIKEKSSREIEEKSSDEIVCKAARQGYLHDDKFHAKYQILNNVTGFLVYYFSFKVMCPCPSKVKEEGISSETDESIAKFLLFKIF